MRRSSLLLIAVCFAASAASGQSSFLSYFEPPAGATECCAAQDKAGNLFAVYWTYGATPDSYAVSILKFDASFHNTATLSTSIFFLPVSAAVDANGAVWLAGFHTLAKVTSSGAPALSVELGGADPNGHTSARAIALDASGNVYVAGTTSQADFPVTPGAFEGFPAAKIPISVQSFYAFGFVSKYSSGGTRLLSTLVAGIQTTYADASSSSGSALPVTTPTAIAVDSSGAATIAGTTNTVDFPVTGSAPQPVCKCRAESGNVFLTRLSADFRSLVWSTFLGGTGPYPVSMTETVSGIALEPDGGVAVAGTTYDADFPVTAGAIETALPAPLVTGEHGFVTRINAAGTAWVFSSYLAGSNNDSISAVQADPQGKIWIAGSAGSPDFPALPGSLQLGAAVVLELTADGSRLLVSERIPGGIGSLWINPDGSVTVSGASAFSVVAGPAYVSASLLRLPAAPVQGVSLLGVADSAASQTAGDVAPGEFLSLYGTGLGPASGFGAALDSSGRIGSQLGGTRVLFDGTEVPLLWVSATQINLLAPYAIAGRTTTTMQVIAPAGSSQTLELSVVPTQPNFFVIVNADGTVNGPNHPAAVGSILTAYISGAGALNQSLPDGTLASNPAPSPTAPVSIAFPADTGACGSQTQRVLYAGSSPGSVVNGLQVNFRFQPPQSTFMGCIYSEYPRLTIGNRTVDSPARLYR